MEIKEIKELESLKKDRMNLRNKLKQSKEEKFNNLLISFLNLNTQILNTDISYWLRKYNQFLKKHSIHNIKK